MSILNKSNKGILSDENLEKDFDRKVPIIFPTKSPVSALTGHSNVEEPPPVPMGLFSRLSKLIKKKLGPLLDAKKSTDEVYSKGYFERHYPGADEKMKGLLHDHAMSAWSNSLNEEDCEEESEEKNAGISVTIHINK